jgi:predicted RNA polymerase sigma factor
VASAEDPLVHRLDASLPAAYPFVGGQSVLDEAQGASGLVDELDLDNYHPFHATRADLLRRLGRDSEAAAAYQRAATMAPTDAERDFLRLGGRASRCANR